ncbi:complex I subunit 1 family protein [Telmatospirillum sp.]|uniref:respiratory chain complex I subunit 1 family protein n=1 Tax=Telmatospirillum sp. TaxID=2079197 RepID=UPI00284521C8|nr:complex I subunit 1 family protein [Telmatospirillum sp.]MDR3440684.1 NADH-quinone oxidoreductase subunit H [Telmatospirillum sp.]
MSDSLSLLFAVLVFPGGLFALVLGLAIKGVDRRVAARLQRRVGPPLLQPFFDLIKLSRKETMVPAQASAFIFRWVPLVGLSAMALAAAMIPINGVYQPSTELGDLLALFYLLAVPAVVLMLAGSASGSPFGAIGFSREMAIMLAYEGPVLLALLSVAIRVGVGEGHLISLSLSDIVAYQIAHGPFLLDPWMWPALLTFLCFFPANLGVLPFDIPEAETEVLEGPLLEYSGPSLGLFKMMSAVKCVVVLGLGITLFLPGGPDGIAGLLVFAVKCTVLAVLGVTVVRTAMGRMRIDQAFYFFLKWPAALGIASLVIVLARS